jgi:hypothetical protein
MRRRLVKGALTAAKALGLGKLIRATVARLPARTGARFEARVYAVRKSAGESHVAIDELQPILTEALALLRKRTGSDEVGDYLEFGVYSGGTMTAADAARRAAGVAGMRLIGFDSFDGMSAEAAAEAPHRFAPGMFRCTAGEARESLRRAGVDLDRVTLVEGWFDRTLTAETRRAHRIDRAGVIMLDCDVYSSSRAALTFSAPAIDGAAVVVCDDWVHSGPEGQQRAFHEFVAEQSFEVEPLGHYRASGHPDGGRVFLVSRRIAAAA